MKAAIAMLLSECLGICVFLAAGQPKSLLPFVHTASKQWRGHLNA
jgi:hypothetical protein